MTAAIQEPSVPLTGFPAIEVEDTLPMYRSTSTTNGPWFFNSSKTQRFDLAAPRGTCYLGTSIEVAVRERIRGTLLNTHIIPPAMVAAMNVYEVRIPATITAADTLSEQAVNFGANRELPTVRPYGVPCAWAEALAAEAFGGLVYASSFTSAAQWNALALFGDDGPKTWGHVKKWSGRMALVDAGMQDRIQDHPPMSAIRIKAPPPPLLKK